jgi:hypothetical protein
MWSNAPVAMQNRVNRPRPKQANSFARKLSTYAKANTVLDPPAKPLQLVCRKRGERVSSFRRRKRAEPRKRFVAKLSAT